MLLMGSVEGSGDLDPLQTLLADGVKLGPATLDHFQTGKLRHACFGQPPFPQVRQWNMDLFLWRQNWAMHHNGSCVLEFLEFENLLAMLFGHGVPEV